MRNTCTVPGPQRNPHSPVSAPTGGVDRQAVREPRRISRRPDSRGCAFPDPRSTTPWSVRTNARNFASTYRRRCPTLPIQLRSAASPVLNVRRVMTAAIEADTGQGRLRCRNITVTKVLGAIQGRGYQSGIERFRSQRSRTWEAVVRPAPAPAPNLSAEWHSVRHVCASGHPVLLDGPDSSPDRRVTGRFSARELA